jgi:hypothetical protein
MPNARLRQQWGSPTNGILRTNLTIDGQTRDFAGVLLPGALVLLFRTSDNAWKDRQVSDSNARYGATPYDTNPHYSVAFVPAAGDTSLITGDNSRLTGDRSGQVSGVTVDTLVGRE